MKTQILKLLHLKQLYARAMCGEIYTNTSIAQPQKHITSNNLESTIRNCSLCHRSKHSKEPTIGLNNPHSTLCFVSEMPLVGENGAWIENKSALMLQNIIKNVFKLPKQNVSVLSLLKCDPHNPHTQKSEILSCVGFVQAQIEQIKPKVCILLGMTVAEHILGRGVDWHLERGRILPHHHTHFFISFALNELVRNPSLKKNALNDFNIAKAKLDAIGDIT